MQEIVNGVQKSFVLAGGSVGLSALFMAGLIVLWYSKYDKKNAVSGLFWYALLMLIFVINPIYIFLVEKKVPELKNDNLYLWLIPTAPVILYAGVTVISSLKMQMKNKAKKAAFIVGIIGVLFLAVTSSYNGFYFGLTNDFSYFTNDENEVFELIDSYIESKNKDNILIIGPDEIVEDVRKYSGKINTLYGKELFVGSFDTQLNHTYESWHYTLYNNLRTPEKQECYEEIAYIGSVNGVDIIILPVESFIKNEVEVPEALIDRYYLKYTNASYLVYLKSAYKEEE